MTDKIAASLLADPKLLEACIQAACCETCNWPACGCTTTATQVRDALTCPSLTSAIAEKTRERDEARNKGYDEGYAQCMKEWQNVCTTEQQRAEAAEAQVKKLELDCQHLLASVRFMEEATGESLDPEDAALIEQIEADLSAAPSSPPQAKREED